MAGSMASKFELGEQVATPGALRAVHQAGESLIDYLKRHVTGDWGDLCDEDRLANEAALADGGRLLSAYTLRTGAVIWVLTEAVGDDGRRAATTTLMPAEY